MQEETEIFNDGSRRVLRPARLGLARVSVLRGSDPKEGVPFIDDYIHTSEEIVNYLTEFSGILRKDHFTSFQGLYLIYLCSWGFESAHIYTHTGTTESGI